METDIFNLKLDDEGPLQLQKQVYMQLRELILKGELLPGVRLPPSRKLADLLRISRKTVVSAYDQLLAEGYVTSQLGSGTYVSPNLPDQDTNQSAPEETAIDASSPKEISEDTHNEPRGDGTSPTRINVSRAEVAFPSPRPEKKLPPSRAETVDMDLSPAESYKQRDPRAPEEDDDDQGLRVFSDYGRRLNNVDLMSFHMEQARFPFFNWQPAFDELPVTEWARIVSKTFRRQDAYLVDYATDPLGHMPLRKAIAERLRNTRGLDCRPEQVVITCGLSQALDMIARLHAQDGTELLVENPSYRPVRDVFRTYGAQVRSIDVDQGGLKTEKLAKLPTHSVRIVYVTPSHQFPTGVVLTLARRLELLKWATECGALLIEDDFDSEFRYRGSPIPAMKTLDKDEQVIYISSFTKVFYPSLAIAYMVVPPKLVPYYARARWLASDQVSLQLQEALAEFISSGLLERHVRRMRTTYALRRKALMEAIEDHLEDCATTHGDHAGLSTLIRLKCDMDDDEILRRARERGIALSSTRACYTRSSVVGEFILGYGNLKENEIRQGIIELRMIVKGK